MQRAQGIELIGEFEGSGFKETAATRPPRRRPGRPAHAAALPRRRGVRRRARRRGDRRRRQRAATAAASARRQRRSSWSREAAAARRARAAPTAARPSSRSARRCSRCQYRTALSRRRLTNAPRGSSRWLHRAGRAGAGARCAIAAFDVWLFGIHGVAGGLRTRSTARGCCSRCCVSVVVADRVPRARARERVPLRRRAARRAWASASTSCGRPSTATSPTPTASAARGRLRTDLGGVYFNAIFALLAGGRLLRAPAEAALLAASAAVRDPSSSSCMPLLRLRRLLRAQRPHRRARHPVAHQADLPLAAAAAEAGAARSPSSSRGCARW